MNRAKIPFRKILLSMLICLLFTYMLLIFGPAEIFFSNVTEFNFIYGEFAYRLIGIGLGGALIVGLIIGVMPKPVTRILDGIILGISIAGYVQIMFLNKGIDLLGLNPHGYEFELKDAIINIVVWLVIVVGTICAVMLIKKPTVLVVVAGGLLAVQLLAIVSLYIGAGENAYEYPPSEYHLSGSGQFQVGDTDNEIVFILDSFSNMDLDNAMTEYPDILAPFTDFVRYTNEDSVYCGTYPSLMHMLTDVEPELDKSVNQWTYDAWTSEKCSSFYKAMNEAGVNVEVYTSDIAMLCGSNDPSELLLDKLSNFGDDTLNRIVDRDTLCMTMFKMSAYRMAPVFLKNAFYTQLDEYMDVVRVVDHPIMHENYDFCNALEDTGLSIDDSASRKLIFEHLMGTHLFLNDEYCYHMEDATPAQTAAGCLNIVAQYLEQLKELGLYDSSYIIITADHGMGYGQQPIFLVKERNASFGSIRISNAPISHHELMATLAYANEISGYDFGNTIYDFIENEKRERTLYVRNMFEEYPEVPCYTGDKNGSENVYVGYTYVGDENDLRELLWDGYSAVIPMMDAYF